MANIFLRPWHEAASKTIIHEQHVLRNNTHRDTIMPQEISSKDYSRHTLQFCIVPCYLDDILRYHCDEPSANGGIIHLGLSLPGLLISAWTVSGGF